MGRKEEIYGKYGGGLWDMEEVYGIWPLTALWIQGLKPLTKPMEEVYGKHGGGLWDMASQSLTVKGIGGFSYAVWRRFMGREAIYQEIWRRVYLKF